MERPLRKWVAWVLSGEPGLAERVCLLLRIAVSGDRYADVLVNGPREGLLDVVDAVLYAHDSIGWIFKVAGDGVPAKRLDWILVNGGSVWRVDEDKCRLVRRVDETVEKAFRHVVRSAPEVAGDHLREAWIAAYGRDPDPG